MFVCELDTIGRGRSTKRKSNEWAKENITHESALMNLLHLFVHIILRCYIGVRLCLSIDVI